MERTLVKNAFLLIMAVMIAMSLYYICFGQASTGWRGLMFYSAEVVESSISRYYYEYCYLPNIHANDGLDEALGCHIGVSNIQSTGTELSSGYDYVSYPSSNFYTTGWK